ncbi:MAG: putative motility protein [Lachnospiraceae bacterium]|nr:putative motility protein [Lachnospiraceae bacterium]
MMLALEMVPASAHLLYSFRTEPGLLFCEFSSWSRLAFYGFSYIYFCYFSTICGFCRIDFRYLRCHNVSTNKSIIVKRCFLRKELMQMSIAPIDSALMSLQQVSSPSSLSGQVSMKMLDQALESSETENANLVKMMELSVNPYVGSNIDLMA